MCELQKGKLGLEDKVYEKGTAEKSRIKDTNLKGTNAEYGGKGCRWEKSRLKGTGVKGIGKAAVDTKENSRIYYGEEEDLEKTKKEEA